MNTSEQILVTDVNVIIHLDKVNLLNEFINDKRIRIVDLVLHEEYEYKANYYSKQVEKIKQIHLSEIQVAEAHKLYEINPRNSVFDYYSYIAARDNNYCLLTGDWKLKKYIDSVVEVRGAIWYVQDLNKKGIINNRELKNIYKNWFDDSSVYINKDILSKLINEKS